MSPSFPRVLQWFEFDHLGHWKQNGCTCVMCKCAWKACAHKYAQFHFNITCVCVCVCLSAEGVWVTPMVINHSITHLSEIRQVRGREGHWGDVGLKGGMGGAKLEWRNAAGERVTERLNDQWAAGFRNGEWAKVLLCCSVRTSRDRGKLPGGDRPRHRQSLSHVWKGTGWQMRTRQAGRRSEDADKLDTSSKFRFRAACVRLKFGRVRNLWGAFQAKCESSNQHWSLESHTVKYNLHFIYV